MATVRADVRGVGDGTRYILPTRECFEADKITNCGVNLTEGLGFLECEDPNDTGPAECRLSFHNIESGGSYWVNAWNIPVPNGPNSRDIRDAAAAPLICEDQLGRRPAVLPPGVSSRQSTSGTGTLFTHYGGSVRG